MDENKMVESLMKEKEALTDVVKSMDEEIGAYKGLGTPEEITEALDRASEIVEKIKGVDLDGIQEKLDTLIEYEELGTFEQVDEALDRGIETITEYKKIGEADEIDEALDRAAEVISEYKELGTPNEITEALDILKDNVITSRCESVAAKFNVKTDMVKSMHEKVDNFDVIEGLLDESLSGRIEKPEYQKEEKLGKVHESVIGRISRGLI